MVRQKGFDMKKLMIWGGIPSAIIAIVAGFVTFSKTVTVYADLPNAVSDNKTEIQKIDKYIEKQQMQNDMMQKMVEQKDEKIISEDGKRYWDSELKKWRAIK